MTKSVKLTPRGKYAVKAMIELASDETEKPVPLIDIAKKTGISLSYLEQLIAALRKHGLVKSFRGPGGGYTLNKPGKEISIAKILLATEDSTPAKRSPVNQKKKSNDKSEDLWHHIGKILHVSLSSITLADVMQENLQNHIPSSKMFDLFK